MTKTFSCNSTERHKVLSEWFSFNSTQRRKDAKAQRFKAAAKNLGSICSFTPEGSVWQLAQGKRALASATLGRQAIINALPKGVPDIQKAFHQKNCRHTLRECINSYIVPRVALADAHLPWANCQALPSGVKLHTELKNFMVTLKLRTKSFNKNFGSLCSIGGEI